jgi:hypothetical protein
MSERYSYQTCPPPPKGERYWIGSPAQWGDDTHVSHFLHANGRTYRQLLRGNRRPLFMVLRRRDDDR